MSYFLDYIYILKIDKLPLKICEECLVVSV